MRAFKICGCALLVAVLIGILGCDNNSYVRKGAEVKANVVTINNCTATPDTVKVPKGETLTWKIDAGDLHSYSIQFPKSTPLSSSSVPPGQDQTVTGDGWCNHGGWLVESWCVYRYNLIQDGSKTCPDPGVHVGPG